ncbi:MAG: nucleotidyl transferase AbiEii/AbiGii toxin family protein [Candidatus Woesearchaeota archaeon]
MISKEEINRIALKNGINSYQQEKEYLLKLFLYFYYKKYQDAVFKGGTSLRFLFGLERFSEDLDFNVKNSEKFREQIKEILKDILKIGIQAYFLKEEMFDDSYNCEIGFNGPLYKGTTQTRNKFRIDAGYRTGIFRKPEWKIMKSEYPETEDKVLILTMNIDEVLAEKACAMLNRKKGRDLYDVWFILKARVKLDKKLLEKKLKIEKIKLDINKIVNKKEYERDMLKLVSRLIPYEQVKKEVIENLNITLKP